MNQTRADSIVDHEPCDGGATMDDWRRDLMSRGPSKTQKEYREVFVCWRWNTDSGGTARGVGGGWWKMG